MAYDYTKALYRRNNFDQPCFWLCEAKGSHSVRIAHGIVGKSYISEIVETNRKPEDEIKSRINAKRKTGYKYLSELKDDMRLPVEGELLSYLTTYLPYNRTTADGSVLPMLAKVYDNANNRLFNKTPLYIGQYKINGVRCFISAVSNSGDMFNPIKLNFQSREGTYWNSLSNLEGYLLYILDQKLLTRMVDEHYILDGELYLPGHSVNEINHFVKDPTCKENAFIQYWCYDLAIEECFQSKRLELLTYYENHYIKRIHNEYEHLNNKDRFVVLPTIELSEDTQAVQIRDHFIDLGFEGLILRNPNAEYQYGKRNLSMIKFKKSTDGRFRIVDIYPEGIKRAGIPLFKCKNDINDSYFECHVGGSYKYQHNVLLNKDCYIGKMMYVEYGERSGVNQLPFHIKTTYIVN